MGNFKVHTSFNTPSALKMPPNSLFTDSSVSYHMYSKDIRVGGWNVETLAVTQKVRVNGARHKPSF